jgi:hypothetical protein
MKDWSELVSQSRRIHRFTASYDTESGCEGCGADIWEGDEIGYVGNELSCSDCIDKADEVLG